MNKYGFELCEAERRVLRGASRTSRTVRSVWSFYLPRERSSQASSKDIETLSEADAGSLGVVVMNWAGSAAMQRCAQAEPKCDEVEEGCKHDLSTTDEKVWSAWRHQVLGM